MPRPEWRAVATGAARLSRLSCEYWIGKIVSIASTAHRVESGTGRCNAAMGREQNPALSSHREARHGRLAAIQNAACITGNTALQNAAVSGVERASGGLTEGGLVACARARLVSSDLTHPATLTQCESPCRAAQTRWDTTPHPRHPSCRTAGPHRRRRAAPSRVCIGLDFARCSALGGRTKLDRAVHEECFAWAEQAQARVRQRGRGSRCASSLTEHPR